MRTALTIADAWGMHDVGTGWTILMIVFWSMLIVGVIWLARSGLRDLGGGRPETALEVLDRRLADGSISTEEYVEKRDLLRDGDHPGRITTPSSAA